MGRNILYLHEKISFDVNFVDSHSTVQCACRKLKMLKIRSREYYDSSSTELFETQSLIVKYLRDGKSGDESLKSVNNMSRARVIQ